MIDAMTSLGGISAQNALEASASPRFAKTRNDAEMTAAAKQFESMFMAQMLQPMFEGLHTDPMFGGGHGEEMMRGFLVQEYGKAVAQGSGNRLSDSIKSEMIRLQSLASVSGETA